MMNQAERRVWLIHALQRKMPRYRGILLPDGEQDQWQLLRSLMNVRPPMAASKEFLEVQDAFLRECTRKKGVVDVAVLPSSPRDPRLCVWKGDITRLRCDAIVNAANSDLLGCFTPGHGCVDNIIHTMAGIQLRLACHKLMEAQGHPEPAGQAKITPGFNLPARYVLHTVGPSINRIVTLMDKATLQSCYRACMALAAEKGLRSVAFCCVATGSLHFPHRLAAQIAVHTVCECLSRPSSVKRVIFNVFRDDDLQIYRDLLY